jgi:uncharacterized lipoprotein YehR (DUF1307 family)
MKKIMSAVMAAVMVMSLAGAAQANSTKKYGRSTAAPAAKMMSPDDI